MNYKEKIENLYNKMRFSALIEDAYVAKKLEEIFPELAESEDERIRKALLEMVHDTKGDELWVDYNVHKEDALAWLEKQGEPIDTEKVLIGARKDVALSIMNYLDNNTQGMCLSSIECEDLDDAVVNSDWGKVYRYMKKKIERQTERRDE